MKILNIYNDFKNFEPVYDNWKKEQDLKESKIKKLLAQKPVDKEALLEQQRAKILVNALTTIDEYAQTKAEDIDSVSQTLLYIAVGSFGAIGTFLGKQLSKVIKNKNLSKSLPSTMGIGFALATFLPVVRTTVINQVRANRIARFDGIHSDKLFHINNFAVLTPEQEKEALEQSKKIPDNVIDKNTIISRANIFNSMSVFKEFTMKQGEFAYLKNEHDKKLKNDLEKLKSVKFSDDEIKQGEKDKILFNKILHKVDMEAQYPLERIEKAVNVAYSSLFAGGVLEYFASEGILNLFNIKNKVIRPVLAWGLPILTVMSLNKQLANFLNDAVKAVRHKKMQEFVNNIDNFKTYNEKELDTTPAVAKEKDKTGFFEFFKNTFKDIEEYKKYQNTQRIDEKKQALSIRNLKLNNKQQADAKLLKRNAELTINTLDDRIQKYASAMETITESTTIPLDIIAPLIGTYTADKLHQTFSKAPKSGILCKAIGAMVAFLPAAMSEIYFVGQQRKAKRCAILQASNQLQDNKKFLDPSQKEAQIKNTVSNWHFNSLSFKNK